jgi:hypothetical protein
VCSSSKVGLCPVVGVYRTRAPSLPASHQPVHLVNWQSGTDRLITGTSTTTGSTTTTVVYCNHSPPDQNWCQVLIFLRIFPDYHIFYKLELIVAIEYIRLGHKIEDSAYLAR